MKIIVTHTSPDMDAITSIWLIKRFLRGWEKAEVQFVQAGERLTFRKTQNTQRTSKTVHQYDSKSVVSNTVRQTTDSQIHRPTDSLAYQSFSEFSEVIEKIGEDEVIHVDTGLGPLDHHQTANENVCAASLTFDFVKRYQKLNRQSRIKNQISERTKDRMEAIGRIVKVVVDIDHFKEVFWGEPVADYHEFSLVNILDGLKLQKQDQDQYYAGFGMMCLDAILREFENRIWAEKEIRTNGVKFETRFGKGIGFETINDAVIKLAQKMGYVIVVRKDPRKGYVRVKARPSQNQKSTLRQSRINSTKPNQKDEMDLTLAYEKLKKMDPQATWYLHIGKKMLLNGSAKNPKMKPTKLGLSDIIRVLEEI